MTIIVDEIPKDKKNGTLFFKRTGKTTNKTNEGITNQNMLVDSSAIFLTSLVSTYIQIKAIIDNNGSEAIMLPKNVLCFEISDIRKIIKAELIILINEYTIPLLI